MLDKGLNRPKRTSLHSDTVKSVLLGTRVSDCRISSNPNRTGSTWRYTRGQCLAETIAAKGGLVPGEVELNGQGTRLYVACWTATLAAVADLPEKLTVCRHCLHRQNLEDEQGAIGRRVFLRSAAGSGGQRIGKPVRQSFLLGS